MPIVVGGVSVLPAVLALVVSNVLGFVWFSLPVFGRMWLKGLGRSLKSSKDMKKGMGKAMFLNAVATLITIVVLDYILGFANAATVIEGASIGFWLWLGFVVPVKLGNVIWQMQQWKVFWIESGYQLVNLAIMGTILAAL